jgi:hypothetical protein
MNETTKKKYESAQDSTLTSVALHSVLQAHIFSLYYLPMVYLTTVSSCVESKDGSEYLETVWQYAVAPKFEVIIIIMALQPFARPWSIFQFLDPIHSRQDSLDGASARRKASTYIQNNTNTE